MIAGQALLLMAIIADAVTITVLGLAELTWRYVYPRQAEFDELRIAVAELEHIHVILGLTARIDTAT